MIRSLYERHTPRLPEPPIEDRLDAATHKKIVKEMNEWKDAPGVLGDPGSIDDDFETLIIERSVSRQKGSWVQVDPDAKDKTSGQDGSQDS